jgi:hypothetical protein
MTIPELFAAGLIAAAAAILVRAIVLSQARRYGADTVSAAIRRDNARSINDVRRLFRQPFEPRR